jgi:hypothetical protein
VLANIQRACLRDRSRRASAGPGRRSATSEGVSTEMVRRAGLASADRRQEFGMVVRAPGQSAPDTWTRGGAWRTDPCGLLRFVRTFRPQRKLPRAHPCVPLCERTDVLKTVRVIATAVLAVCVFLGLMTAVAAIASPPSTPEVLVIMVAAATTAHLALRRWPAKA